MTIDLDALEKLADEATPGLEWFADMDGLRLKAEPPGNHFIPAEKTLALCATGDHAYRVLTYLAQVQPATIKALIAELREARSVIKPLADCEIIEPDQPLADDITARYLFSMGEIRAARAFLARNGKSDLQKMQNSARNGKGGRIVQAMESES